MGITLTNTMKTIFYIFILATCISLFACNPKNDKAKQDKKSPSSMLTYTDNEWKENFKDLMLCNCVLMGLGDSTLSINIRLKDKSFYDPIGFVMNDDIKQELIPVLKQMQQDSLNSLTTLAEAAQGKKIFKSCIKLYKSKRLDSIAMKKLNKWKHMDIDSSMAITAPSY